MALTLPDAAALSASESPSAQTVSAGTGFRVSITLEVLLYAGLALLALVLRVGALDRAPLDNAEAQQALAALRTVDVRVPGDVPTADSPLTFALNALTFGVLPANEITARLPVALAGVLLVLSPALWRRYLHPLPPLVISALLAVSPVAVLAARTSSPAVWSMLLALVAPWLVLRYAESEQRAYAFGAALAVAALVLLAEPAGFLTLLALLFGVVFAWLTSDPLEADILAAIRQAARAWPWADSAVAAGIGVAVIATGLFWVPSGLTVVGGALWEGLRGFVTRPSGVPVAFPMWVALRYETGLMLFGLLAIVHAVREGGFFARVLVGWARAGMVWAIGYAGAGAAHALWITVPLSVLIGLMVTGWITERADRLWRVPSWAISAHAVITWGLWLAIGLSVILLGKRLLLDLPPEATNFRTLLSKLLVGVYDRNTNSALRPVQSVEIQPGVLTYEYVLGFIQLRLLITLLVTLLNGVLFFLVGSLWGARAAWRGFALGTLAAVILFAAGLGGRAAFGTPGDPREYWYTDPVTDDVYDLRATLREMSLRATGDPRLIDVTAWVPEDGALAWALRDYPNTVFVHGVGPEVTSAAVLMPVLPDQPRMGADYVGKTLIITQTWSLDSLSWRDNVMWYYRHESRVKPVDSVLARLWVRKDIYGVQQVTED